MRVPALLLTFLLAGCSGVQSSLDPAGEEAANIATLFWWMMGVGAFIWAAVIGLAIYAVRVGPHEHNSRNANRLVLTGAIAPAIVLGGLLIYGLAMLPPMVQAAPEDSLRVSVQGEQWWWRFRYEVPDRQPFETANVLWLPVNEPVQFEVASFDVVHSFWIPSIGGKIDLIPGRYNHLALHPTKTGRFRGVCAEFCGRGHAAMAFDVFVVTREEFDRWVNDRLSAATPAAVTQEPTP